MGIGISIKDYCLASYSALAKGREALGRPVVLTVEPTNVCNLKCPVCETGAGILRRSKGFMPLGDFKTVLDNVGRQVNTVLLYFMGEPFLNKDCYGMIAEARRRGIYVSVCTNGEFVDVKLLVESGVSEVNFQIGGLTQRMHKKYRIGGNLEKTMSNLMGLGKLKRNGKPRIVLGFIVMRHNEHEAETLDLLGKNTGIDDCEAIIPCVRTIEQGREFLPESDKYWFYDRDAFSKGVLKPKVVPHNRCWWIYYSTVVCWNGDVVPCCRDAQGDFVMGNALGQDFSGIWNGKKYRVFRHRIANEQDKVGLCRLCSGYGIPRLRR